MRKSEPTAPQAAPSVGVARPNTMLPSAASTSTAGGTRPWKNCTHTSRMFAGCSSIGSAGPSAGSIMQRIIA